jgi:uncharacterized membrane protein YjjP (DUF1212 family)
MIALAQSEVQLPSPLPEVDAGAWTTFVRAMMTATTTHVSASNALGAFEMTPRRLQDLGVLSELKRTRSIKSRRVIWAANKEIDHESAKKFLRSISMQMKIFERSMVDYASKLSAGAVKLPDGCSLSGALALCHRAGFAGLSAARFPATQDLYQRANGIF